MKYDIEPNIEREKEIDENKNNQNNNAPKKKMSHGCLLLIVLAIGAVVLFMFVLFKRMAVTEERNANNTTNTSTPGFFKRTATINDITITEDNFDLSAFGEKLVFNPKCDIDNLELTFEFVKNNTTLKKIIKSIGNVKEGRQYTVTISITELNTDIIFGSGVRCRYYVSSGTKTVFN